MCDYQTASHCFPIFYFLFFLLSYCSTPWCDFICISCIIHNMDRQIDEPILVQAYMRLLLILAGTQSHGPTASHHIHALLKENYQGKVARASTTQFYPLLKCSSRTTVWSPPTHATCESVIVVPRLACPQRATVSTQHHGQCCCGWWGNIVFVFFWMQKTTVAEAT